ncbi:hypothetical protein [Streptomyces sp. bgisy027]|uniref:hypothetical protein n=1 Tax=Streptomyces sp. bgisy027 TaxID=3413770 RepID=UPI003D70C361
MSAWTALRSTRPTCARKPTAGHGRTGTDAPADHARKRDDHAADDRAGRTRHTHARHAGRTATTDTEIGGHPVRTGAIVTVWNASAHHDELVFDAPGELRLDRTPNRHVTFAHGPVHSAFLSGVGTLPLTPKAACTAVPPTWPVPCGCGPA